MSLFFESIKYQGGKFFNLTYHQERVNRTLRDFSMPEYIDLDGLPVLHDDDRLYKCRVVYNGTHYDCEWVLYEKRAIDKLVVVHSDPIDYSYKHVDRSAIDNLGRGIDKNSDLLICVDGVVKDSSYSNLAFLQENIWYTPRSPLLPGTKRQSLLDLKKIVPRDIRIDSLADYERVSLINAMLDLSELEIDIDRVHI